MIAIVRVAVALLALLPLLARGAWAAPALWLVEGPHAKVYLFGTIHVLKPDVQWHTAVLDAAIAESSDLWLEVPDGDDPAAMIPLVQSLGLDPAHPLSSKLSKTDLARVDAAAKDMGAPGEAALDPLRPWFASVMLSVGPLLKAGYDMKYGVDRQLKGIFTAAGKPVRGFETIEQQLHILADLPSDEEIAMLQATLDATASTGPTIERLVGAWSSGKVDRFASIEDDDMFRRSPSLYNALVVSRNAAWAGRLDTRLRERGVSFVAVGAAHLSGPISVEANLSKRGYRVTRVQ